MDDLLDERHFLRDGCRHHTEAGHHWIEGCDSSSHHAEVWIEIWRPEKKRKNRQWDHSVGPSLWMKHWEQRVPPKPTFGFSQWSHVVLTDYSVTNKQLFPQWITQPSMNKTSGKQHAYLNKFQVRHSRPHSSRLTDDLTDIVSIGKVQKRTKLLSTCSLSQTWFFCFRKPQQSSVCGSAHIYTAV